MNTSMAGLAQRHTVTPVQSGSTLRPISNVVGVQIHEPIAEHAPIAVTSQNSISPTRHRFLSHQEPSRDEMSGRTGERMPHSGWNTSCGWPKSPPTISNLSHISAPTHPMRRAAPREQPGRNSYVRLRVKHRSTGPTSTSCSLGPETAKLLKQTRR